MCSRAEKDLILELFKLHFIFNLLTNSIYILAIYAHHIYMLKFF
jgi:hypothetical protein